MTNRITWVDGRFSSMDGWVKSRHIGSISHTTQRGAPDNESYILRMGLIGGKHESRHPNQDAAKEHSERVLVRQMALIGFVPAEDLEAARTERLMDMEDGAV